MSRSNNIELVNPSVRWMEWNGEQGKFHYYDKEKKQKVDVEGNITFLLLDQLACVKGWNDASDSGIYSNEVRDLTKEPLAVKSFKGGPIASGFYKDIKDKVAANGGHFTGSIYVAVKIDGELKIANIQLKGASLNAWIEFRNKYKREIYQKAITLSGVQEGQKGRVIYKTPVFSLKDVSQETDNIAKSLDMDLQNYLKAYLSRTVSEQTEPIKEVEPEPPAKQYNQADLIPTFDDDLPF